MACFQVKDQEILEVLLTVMAHLLRLAPANLYDTSPEKRYADELADQILDTKIRRISFALGSEHKGVVAAALFLIASLIGRGELHATRVFNSFDFSLPAFIKANRATRYGDPCGIVFYIVCCWLGL